MRSIAPLILALAVLFAPFSALAQGEKDPMAMLRDELKSLSKKVDDLKAQNKAIQETQAQILKELDVLKIRIHRRG